ncbi:hypothetical protein BC643_3023 [Mangrovibacterium diazotrophicum]|uniref:Uncharacterized protein n=1 Tax=Mangrovibacterium diazotrophicum TaxID=1261403 RepID=A0A419WB05_9BACT|nr:hypothetical protein BC643_3023 [Mangrovibacterium diazotrophicum]
MNTSDSYTILDNLNSQTPSTLAELNSPQNMPGKNPSRTIHTMDYPALLPATFAVSSRILDRASHFILSSRVHRSGWLFQDVSLLHKYNLALLLNSQREHKLLS